MTKIYEGAKRLALPFSVIIYKYLIEKGCQAYTYEESIKPKKNIIASTLKISKAHMKPRAHDDDDGDEAEIERKSSILKGLDNVQAVIYIRSLYPY